MSQPIHSAVVVLQHVRQFEAQLASAAREKGERLTFEWTNLYLEKVPPFIALKVKRSGVSEAVRNFGTPFFQVYDETQANEALRQLIVELKL